MIGLIFHKKPCGRIRNSAIGNKPLWKKHSDALYKILLKYAEYFDVSLDCFLPHGYRRANYIIMRRRHWKAVPLKMIRGKNLWICVSIPLPLWILNSKKWCWIWQGKKKNEKLVVDSTEITILKIEDKDCISLTDMIKAKDGDFSFQIGYVTGIQLNFQEFGNRYIARFLIMANSP